MTKKKESYVDSLRNYFYEPPLSPPKQKEKPFLPKGSTLSKKIEVQKPKEPSAPKYDNKDLEVQNSLGDKTWEDFRQKILNCHFCSLSKSRTQSVFGSGDPNSMLYIIGEAPGGEEDIQGMPFVGRSGQLLTKMLLAIGIERKDIFISNIVKCRPPSNRDPLPEEINSCSPYLKQQIQMGKPKILLALGRYSGTFLLGGDPKASLGSMRGSFHETDYGRVLVTYHPAAVLRSPMQRRPDVWEDLKILARALFEEGFYKDPLKKKILLEHQIIEE